jgi:DNA-binding beta-propeller fold protein YncE
MARRVTVVAIVIALFQLTLVNAVITQSAMPDPLRLETKIPLGNVSGRIDHMAVDLVHHRLFVAELGNDTVGVVDLDTQKVVHRLSGLKEPQGIGYVQSSDSLYVANGGDGSVRIFAGTEYAPAGRIDLGADADNIRVDLSGNRLLVGYGSGGIGTINLRSNNKIESFSLKAHPESFQLDAGTHQIFVNLPNSRAIAVVDANTGQQRATWSVSHGGNFPMALDADRHRVLVVFRSPPKFAAFDWQTGNLISEFDTCGDADDLFLDSKRQRIYITCGAGFIDVLKADDAKYSRLGKITTVAGARTGLFVGDMDRLFVAARAQSGQPASIWVFRAAP